MGNSDPVYYPHDGSARLGAAKVTINRTWWGGYTLSVSLKHWNIVTPGGVVVGQLPGNGSALFYVKDRLGSVRTVIDTTGYEREMKDYYAFGKRIRHRSYGGAQAKEGYTGHEREPETGLLNAGARRYMPVLGRWLTPDPLGGRLPRPLPLQLRHEQSHRPHRPDRAGAVLHHRRVAHTERQHGVRCPDSVPVAGTFAEHARWRRRLRVRHRQ
ncbi:MAG: hypothetical protein BRD45_03565 [Bacteroidetes bacterium QS_8_64_10]|nr:MAG: hypothetical protein BRD45_03565 [Bacteroidetes bacterium QS_8_64_10]